MEYKIKFKTGKHDVVIVSKGMKLCVPVKYKGCNITYFHHFDVIPIYGNIATAKRYKITTSDGRTIFSLDEKENPCTL